MGETNVRYEGWPEITGILCSTKGREFEPKGKVLSQKWGSHIKRPAAIEADVKAPGQRKALRKR